jgi:hypothetical protein
LSLGGVQMLSLLMKRSRRRTCVRCAVVWFCAVSLVVVLANRVPRFPANETSWVPSAPSQVTAKVLAKDFYVFLPPASGAITLLRSIPSRLDTREEHPIFSIPLDSCLFTRPPPFA